MSKKAWFSLLLCHLLLFDATLSSKIVMENPETTVSETAGAAANNATIKQTSLPVTTTTQLPATGVTEDGKHENPEISLTQGESLEKPLPKKRGILDALYQPGNFDETGYDTNEDTGPDEGFSTSKSDFEEKPFYKYGDAAFVADDGYFENEGRTKRTADEEEPYFNQKEHFISLTPNELMGLLKILQTQTNGDEPSNHVNDNIVGSIEADMRGADGFKVRNTYDKAFATYLSKLKNLPVVRKRRNSVYEHQISNTPSYGRLIL